MVDTVGWLDLAGFQILNYKPLLHTYISLINYLQIQCGFSKQDYTIKF